MSCIFLLQGTLMVSEACEEPRFRGGRRAGVSSGAGSFDTVYDPGCVLGEVCVTGTQNAWPDGVGTVVGDQALKYLLVDEQHIAQAVKRYLEDVVTVLEMEVKDRTEEDRTLVLQLFELVQLKEVHLAQVAPVSQRRLTEITQVRRYKPGEVLLMENTPAEDVIIMLAGEVIVQEPVVTFGNELCLAEDLCTLIPTRRTQTRLNPGNEHKPPAVYPHDGEILSLNRNQLVWNKSRVTAKSAVTVAVISRDSFSEMLDEMLMDASRVIKKPVANRSTEECDAVTHLWFQQILASDPQLRAAQHLLDQHLWLQMQIQMEVQKYASGDIIADGGWTIQGAFLIVLGEVTVHPGQLAVDEGNEGAMPALPWWRYADKIMKVAPKSSSAKKVFVANKDSSVVLRRGKVIGAADYADMITTHSKPNRQYRIVANSAVHGIWVPFSAHHKHMKGLLCRIEMILRDPPSDRAPSDLRFLMQSLKAKIPFLKDMEEERCFDVCANTILRTCVPGELVVVEADKSDSYHFVLAGSCDVLRPTVEEIVQPAVEVVQEEPAADATPGHSPAGHSPKLIRSLKVQQICCALHNALPGASKSSSHPDVSRVAHSNCPDSQLYRCVQVGAIVPLPVEGRISCMLPGSGFGEVALMSPDATWPTSIVANGGSEGLTLLLQIGRKSYRQAMRMDQSRMAEVQDCIEFISKLEVFECFSKRQLTQLGYVFTRRKVHLGESIVLCGEDADTAFVIEEGSVISSVPLQQTDHGHMPKEVQLSVMGSGAIVGFDAAITKSEHKCTVRASMPSVVYEIAATHLRHIFTTAKTASAHMTEHLAGMNAWHMRRMQKVLAELSIRCRPVLLQSAPALLPPPPKGPPKRKLPPHMTPLPARHAPPGQLSASEKLLQHKNPTSFSEAAKALMLAPLTRKKESLRCRARAAGYVATGQRLMPDFRHRQLERGHSADEESDAQPQQFRSPQSLVDTEDNSFGNSKWVCNIRKVSLKPSNPDGKKRGKKQTAVGYTSNMKLDLQTINVSTLGNSDNYEQLEKALMAQVNGIMETTSLLEEASDVWDMNEASGLADDSSAQAQQLDIETTDRTRADGLKPCPPNRSHHTGRNSFSEHTGHKRGAQRTGRNSFSEHAFRYDWDAKNLNPFEFSPWISTKGGPSREPPSQTTTTTNKGFLPKLPGLGRGLPARSHGYPGKPAFVSFINSNQSKGAPQTSRRHTLEGAPQLEVGLDMSSTAGWSTHR